MFYGYELINQTQYTKIFLGIWTTYFVTTTLAENPCNRVKNADLCQKPRLKNRGMLKDWSITFY